MYFITVVCSYIVQIIIILLLVYNNYVPESGWEKGAVCDHKPESKNENCIMRIQLAS